MESVGTSPPLHIFCAYAHEDRTLFQQLKKALAILIDQKVVSVWHDGDLLPGASWELEIERELNSADIILLLVSPSFMASDYCRGKEMQWAIIRHTTGEARVIPLLAKPTPGWETTALGALQALPRNAKPISSWRFRDEAFASIIEDLRTVIQAVRHEDRYPLKEYTLTVRTAAYDQPQIPLSAQERALQQAEQWREKIAQVGLLQQTSEEKQQKTWTLTECLQTCTITFCQPAQARDRFFHLYQAVDILLTSQHPTLLDRLIEAGQHHYRAIQWTLLGDLDILTLGRLIHARLGRPYYNPMQIESTYHVEYPLYAKDERWADPHPITVTLTSRGPSFPGEPILPARICLIYDNSPYAGFYHVHTLLSVQKILAYLRGDPLSRGELLYEQWQRLIEKACTPVVLQGRETMPELLLGIVMALAAIALVTSLRNRSRCTLEDAVLRSGCPESELQELIQRRYLIYRRAYFLFGPRSLDATAIVVARADYARVKKAKADADAYIRKVAEEVAASIDKSNRQHQEEMENLEALKRAHATILQRLRAQLNLMPAEVAAALRTLDLPPNASFEEIRQRFRLLAKQHHPDAGGDPHQFCLIKEAYDQVVVWIQSQA